MVYKLLRFASNTKNNNKEERKTPGPLAIKNNKPRMKRIALSALASSNALQLPIAPLPSLESTAARYLDSLRAIKGANIVVAQGAKLEAFVSGPGKKLQKELEARVGASGGLSYIQELLRSAALRNRAPLEVRRNPGVVVKREALAGVTDGSQAGVAAALIHGVGCWILEAMEKGVAVRESGEGGSGKIDLSVLCHELGRSLVPSKERDEVRTVPLDRLRHVVVLHDGHANLVRVLDESGKRVEERDAIQRALEVILKTTPDQDNPAPVAVLTAGSRSLWGQAYAELVKTPANAETLKLFEEGILVVCLDSKAWGSEGSGSVVGSTVLHGGKEEVENRWYDKHQLIVSADGRAAWNFDASSSWAPQWAAWIEEVLRLAVSGGSGSGSRGGGVPAEVAGKLLRPLVVTYGKSFASHIRTARQEALGLVTSTAGQGVTLPLGSRELTRVGMSGESFVQAALQLAHHRQRGCLCASSSVVNQSGFYGGRIDVARATTAEMQEMCEKFEKHVKPGEGVVPSSVREELAAVARAAAARHTALVAEVACGKGIDNHLLALQSLAEELSDKDALQFFADPVYQQSGRFLLNVCEWSRPWVSLFALGPVEGRGCGVGFTVDASDTRVHVAMDEDSPLCSSEEYSQSIITAAMDLYRVLGGTSV